MFNRQPKGWIERLNPPHSEHLVPLTDDELHLKHWRMEWIDYPTFKAFLIQVLGVPLFDRLLRDPNGKMNITRLNLAQTIVFHCSRHRSVSGRRTEKECDLQWTLIANLLRSEIEDTVRHRSQLAPAFEQAVLGLPLSPAQQIELIEAVRAMDLFQLPWWAEITVH